MYAGSVSTEPIVYLRDRFLPATDAHLSIYDLGIVLGATITDLLRTFRQEPYRLEQHVARFHESCRYARIAPPLAAAALGEATRELIRHNAALLPTGGELCVVYFITPGESPIYAGSAAGVNAVPTFCIHSFPMPFALFRRFFVDGIHLVVPQTRHVPPVCVDPKVKNRSRLHWWLAEQEAKLVDPGAMPLLLDTEGNLTETSGANFLLVKNGEVLSPTPRNILLGVSRHVIRELCGRLGIGFRERDLQLYDAVTADEAFVATTPYCMAPVTRINGMPVARGPVFERLIEAWSGDVGVDIRRQFVDAD